MDTSGYDGRVSYDSDASSGERQLDMELSRFLADECAPHKFDSESAGEVPLGDDVGFVDIRNSIDIPDLNFGDGLHQSLAESEVSSTSEQVTEQTPATAAQVSQHSTSLRVVIPASVLLPPPPSDLRPKRKQPAKQSPSSPWSMRQPAVKEELMQLRQQVNQLQSRLERLQHARRDSEHRSRHWEQILRHEIKEKQKSEAENAKLKRKLTLELEATQRVGTLLREFQDYAPLEENKK